MRPLVAASLVGVLVLACNSRRPPVASGAVDTPSDGSSDEPATTASAPVTPPSTAKPGCVDAPFTEERAPDEPMTSTTPAKPVAFDGVGCRAGRVVKRDEAGRLRVCTLARSTTFDRARCREGESVGFAPTGELVGCVVDGAVDGLDVVFPPGTRMSWHVEGGIASASIEAAMEVGGYRVQKELRAHPNGRLSYLVLAQPRTIAGVALEERAKVWLREDGSPWHVEYVVDAGRRLHGEGWSDTRKITFDCTGRIVSDTIVHYQAPTRPPLPRVRSK